MSLQRHLMMAAIAAAWQAEAEKVAQQPRMVTVYPPAPKGTQADRERMVKAQAKRERRANKHKTKRMLAAVRKAPPDARVTELNGKALFFSVNAEQEWADSHYQLTDAEEAEAQALSNGGAMTLARKFGGQP